MSRAFVKEEEGERLNYLDDEAYRAKRLEGLRIQEKKLDFLLNDPKSDDIAPDKRQRWIDETRADIERTKRELKIPG